MLDRILVVGRNGDGMFYNGVNPKTGEIVHKELADSWGYTLNGFYTVYLIDHKEEYKQAVLKVFSNLHKYKSYDWESGSADGYADAIESALNLYNRIPDKRIADWIDSEIEVMWTMQQESGIIEGWHGDGNFARTTIMYNLWKSKGVYVQPWRNDVRLGAEQKGDSLLISIMSEQPWKGKIFIDHNRFKDNMKLPIDWPRINQFPQWYVTGTKEQYVVVDLCAGEKSTRNQDQIGNGLRVEVNGSKRLVLY